MDQEKFGLLIKKIRKENHLTQKDLANKYNVTYQAVSKWENGLCLPDIEIIKRISSDYNINLENILDGNYKKNTLKKYFILIIIGFLLIISIILLLGKKDYEFKTITTTCDNFKIYGSLAYSENKSSIYISNIKFCGNDQNKYININCTLFESNKNSDNKIDSYNKKYLKETTIDNMLNDISFSKDNYSRICKKYDNSSLYIEIKLTKLNNEIVNYTIPIDISNNCK